MLHVRSLHVRIATLAKWGNSQGILIPKSVCEALELSIGDKMELRMDAPSLVLTPQRKYHRSRRP
ncbi:AbrB/MazE/SpoVT family DNA-binding domain-containing protein [Eggerthellaceae bacterium zg-893]|nr:AbrB/MazE/SpoVT family DNA-binding domain-containing protein [Eggerthellaceae bacterium zg-893]